jgi:transposase-like protein
MRYLQYKGVIEREYKKSLKKIMYELCVEQGLTASQGAKKLGVAKELFVYWRRHYRYERKQLLFDETVKDLNKLQDLYAEEAKSIDLSKPLLYENEKSVRGLEELVDRMIDYYKMVHYNSKGLAIAAAKLPLYEFGHTIVEQYRQGELLAEAKMHSSSAK